MLMILTPSLNLTHSLEGLVICHQSVLAVLAPALPVAPRVTSATTPPNIPHPHQSHSLATTLMPLMKHGCIFIADILSPCAASGASCAQLSTLTFSSLMMLLSVAN